MTREQIVAILTEGGIENPSRLVVDTLIARYNDEKKAAVAEVEASAKEKYNGYKSKEDYEALEKEIATLKDAGAKADRVNKLKLKGINEKYIEFADGLLKDSKNFDKDLEKYFSDYPEQFAQKKEEPKSHTFENLDDGKKAQANKDAEWNDAFLSGLGLKN
ncbi:MAG: hypothetical protein NC087_04420 [Anaeroplasma bactoclasticum]|nr:hypothetical protein [Anaeroplasma bactoclasticum]